MSFSPRGVKVPHRKKTADMPAVRLQGVSSVTIPMSMHIGKPAKPVVSKGDEVFVGTLIAEADGYVSSPVYSSVSGKVKSISEIVMPNGSRSSAITLESDGNMTADPKLEPPVIGSRDDFIEAVKKSGIVGLGGAGFPTHVKLSCKEEQRIEELVINCAECEPYITSDTRTMLDRREDMLSGIKAITEHLSIPTVVIGIEKNNPAIGAMKELAAKLDNARVKILPTMYPQGAEKVLIYKTTGKVTPAGKLPADVGCIVSNCTTVAAIGSYLKTGMPLVEKCLTVDGGAVAEPKNVIAPIGISVSDLLALCGGVKEDPAKIIMGGPMMGIALSDGQMPVMKNTNAIVAFTAAEAKRKPETACIKCGSCASHCPYGLNPAAFMRAYKKDDIKDLVRLRADLCMECGCCTYICPAGQPLAVTNRLAKAALREYLKNENKDGGNK